MYQIKTLQEKQSSGYADRRIYVPLDLVVNRWLYEHPDIEIINIQYFRGKDRYDVDTAIITYKPSEDQINEIKEYQVGVDKRRYQAKHGISNIRSDYIY